MIKKNNEIEIVAPSTKETQQITNDSKNMDVAEPLILQHNGI